VATIPVRVFSMSVTSRRLALLGLASAGVILFGVVIAAVPYRGHAGEAYSPLNHFISELGEVATSRLAWAFNLGIILGGSAWARSCSCSRTGSAAVSGSPSWRPALPRAFQERSSASSRWTTYPLIGSCLASSF